MRSRRTELLPFLLVLTLVLAPHPVPAQVVRREMLEFRVEIKSSGKDGECKGPQSWRTTIMACPVPDFIDESICFTPTFAMADLKDLRDRQGWKANLDKLRLYGQKVGESILGPPGTPDTLRDALIATLAQAQDNNKNKGVRFVVELKPDVTADGIISPSELPIELVCFPGIKRLADFPASEFELTVSRALEPPRSEIQEVIYPIRMLVVAASPNERRSYERGRVQESHQGRAGGIWLSREGSGSRTVLSRLSSVSRRHSRGFRDCWATPRSPGTSSILWATAGSGRIPTHPEDPTPQAHLLFERPDKLKEYVGARDFATAFATHPELRLVVLTACSTAAATPDQLGRREFPASAFEGVAQYLMRFRKVTAVVAMQFDFEVHAASVFSQAFYESLLSEQQDIDMAVAQARFALSKKFMKNTGVWITPALYSRSAERPCVRVPGEARAGRFRHRRRYPPAPARREADSSKTLMISSVSPRLPSRTRPGGSASRTCHRYRSGRFDSSRRGPATRSAGPIRP